MKIAVSATGPTLEAAVDPRFGRCSFFIIVETESLDFEAIENPNIALSGGAGIQSAQMMAEKGVQSVLTGNCGPNASNTFSATGIEVITGCSGIVKDAINDFKSGSYANSQQQNQVISPNQTSNTPNFQQSNAFGSGTSRMGQGRGMGGGGGRGMGGGGGRGMGGGGGRGMGGGGGQGGGQGGGKGSGRGMGR